MRKGKSVSYEGVRDSIQPDRKKILIHAAVNFTTRLNIIYIEKFYKFCSVALAMLADRCFSASRRE